MSSPPPACTPTRTPLPNESDSEAIRQALLQHSEEAATAIRQLDLARDRAKQLVENVNNAFLYADAPDRLESMRREIGYW